LKGEEHTNAGRKEELLEGNGEKEGGGKGKVMTSRKNNLNKNIYCEAEDGRHNERKKDHQKWVSEQEYGVIIQDRIDEDTRR